MYIYIYISFFSVLFDSFVLLSSVACSPFFSWISSLANPYDEGAEGRDAGRPRRSYPPRRPRRRPDNQENAAASAEEGGRGRRQNNNKNRRRRRRNNNNNDNPQVG